MYTPWPFSLKLLVPSAASRFQAQHVPAARFAICAAMADSRLKSQRARAASQWEGYRFEEHFDKAGAKSRGQKQNRPGIFGPDDFEIYIPAVAECLKKTWWKGQIILCNQTVVEDPTFAETYKISLFVSANGGDIDKPDHFWF